MMRTDTELLDWLQAELDKKRYTGKCVYRLSEQCRGMRLHESGRTNAKDSVRAAIKDAMNREVK